MANWREKINLNKVIADMSEQYDLDCVEEDCPAKVKEALAAEVEKSINLRHFAPRIRKAKSIAAVNRILARVFAVADDSLVWCGMPW